MENDFKFRSAVKMAGFHLILILACVLTCFRISGVIKAAEKAISLEVTDEEIQLSPGDYGVISMKYSQGFEDVANWKYTIQSISNSQCFTLVEDTGAYEAKELGEVQILATGYNSEGETVIQLRFTVEISVDMTDVTLDTEAISGYYSSQKVTTAYSQIKDLYIQSTTELNNTNCSVYATTSNGKMIAYADFVENNHLKLYLAGFGEDVINLTLNGKTFSIPVSIKKIKINRSTALVQKGRSLQLKVTGVSDPIQWKSSKKILSVSSTGNVKCKKTGCAIVTAKVKGETLACAVNVVSKKMLKVIKTAKHIGKTRKYSQPKRMQKKYYDCSSLVWLAYKTKGITFGDRRYAPVAASICKWCARHGKRIAKKYTFQQIQNQLFLPGDLMFEPGAKNGRYLGIYHVEMFVGYGVTGVDASGKPILCEKWANRVDNRYCGGYIIMRTYK